MAENLIPPSSWGEDGRAGQRLRLASLAPVFNPDEHQFYVDVLKRAIDAPSSRNVALTGAYGTGKSSVLERIQDLYGDRVLTLSLSTIASEEYDSDAGQPMKSAPAETRTNRIQKEIVKQLLYRLEPGSVPRSRFRRTKAPDRTREWRIAAVVGGTLFLLLVTLGALPALFEALLPQWWRQIIGYPLALALIVGGAWAVGVLVRSRVVLSASLKTGPATITLSKDADSYFDEYLDEIVYFFEVSACDIVVIEDIDRFEDIQIFDTLRTLNGLLNGAEQIVPRIVFIYAIRDSVFNLIGKAPKGKKKRARSEVSQSDMVVDDAKAALKRASRTKFFDVVVPVVPFVSADNARDLMSEAMRSEHFEIDPALIRLAARHVADMRLIHNIRNEFEIYRNRLVETPRAIPGINDDLVFALVLFKNVHLEDFEKIRHRESSLDRLYEVWRVLVRTGLDDSAKSLAQLRIDRQQEATTEAIASRLGRRLLHLQESLKTAAVAAETGAEVELITPLTDEDPENVAGWEEIIDGESQTIRVTQTAEVIDLSYSAEQLGQLFGSDVTLRAEHSVDVADLERKILEAEQEADHLRHSTWQSLARRGTSTVRPDLLDFTLNSRAGDPFKEPISFDGAIDAVLTSELARSLVRSGFITSHFALYASSYYGTHLGPEALEYIRRCIEPGIPDMTYPLSADDVSQILIEQGAGTDDEAELFSDASVYNVSIMDYLLCHRRAASTVVIRRLGVLGDQERSFIDVYVSQGQEAGAMLEILAEHWPGILQYVAIEAGVAPETRTSMLNKVIGAMGDGEYPIDDEAATVIENTYRDIAAILRPTSEAAAHRVMTHLAAGNVRFEWLEPLNDHARVAAVQLRMCPLTEANLRAIAPSRPVGLDILRNDSLAYQFVLDNLDQYLRLVDTVSDISVIVDADSFAAILNDAAKDSSQATMDRLVDLSSPQSRVAKLTDAPIGTWPSLVGGDRTASTFANISGYIEENGVDQALGAFLRRRRKVTAAHGASAELRQRVAVAILAARDVIPSTYTRVSLAASTGVGVIPTALIEPESGDLVARLIGRGLVADSSSAFGSELMIDWATLEITIVMSPGFGTFVSPEILPVSYIAPFVRSSRIESGKQRPVVGNLAKYLAGGSKADVRRIAAALIERRWLLSASLIEILRAAGAADSQVVQLAAARGDKITMTELKALLAALGGDYARAAAGGRGSPSFVVDEAHERVLGRLVGDTLRRVEMKSFKRQGERLVAVLRA